MDSIVQKFERTAQHYGDRIAIRSRHESVSYGDLWRQSRAVATRLRQQGLVPGERVAVVLDNSAAYVAAFYGGLMAGGIVVALNAAAKSRDFTRWLEHAGARWLFAEAGNREVAAACSALTQPPLRLTVADVQDGGASDAQADANTAADASVDENAGIGAVARDTPALLLYTSGTTGNPKGVLLSHGNLASNTEAIVGYLRLSAADSSVVVLPFFYSYGNSVLHTHLAVGATLILEANLVYPHQVVETLAESRATGFAGVPSTFALLLARVQLAEYDLSALRYLTQAGGAMPVALTQRLRQALPRARLHVMYGQTEATARISALPPERLAEKLGSVGLPIEGVELSVRQEDESPASPMTLGEVWVRGPNVMLGYWHNDVATAEVRRGEWLRTGDQGHLDAEGYLFLAGRRGDMIKTGAHRVNPLDIEEVIAELPGVAEVAVVPAPDELLGETIRAVVVMQTGVPEDEMRVKAWCRERLASYKIPKHVEFSTGLPRTASGKIRRQQLISGSGA